MANNALDDILNMEERTDQTSMPEDTTSLDDIINFEDRKGGETSTDVPPNPHGVMHTAAEAAGGAWASAGSLAGNAGFAAPGGPITGVAGRMAGAGLGGALGYGGYRAHEDLRDGGVPQLLSNLGDTLVESAKFGATSALTEGVVPGAGWLYRSTPIRAAREWASKKWGESLSGQLDRVIDSVGTTMRDVDNLVRTGQRRAALKAGTDRPAAGLTLGQLSDDPSSTANALEGVAQSTWFGNTASRQRQWSSEGANQFADDLAKQLQGVSTEEVGQGLTWAVKDNFKNLYSAAADTAYDGLRAATAGTRPVVAVPILKDLRTPNSTLGNNVITELKKLRSVNPDPQAIAEIDNLINTLSVTQSQANKGALTRIPPNLSLDQALRLKTILGGIADSKAGLDSMADTAAKTTAETYAKQIDDAIRKGLGKSPDLLREYDSAAAHYAQGVATFKNEMVKKVVDGLTKSPGALESILLKPEQRETIAAVKQAVGPVWDSQVAPKLRSIMLMNAKDGDTFNGQKLMSSIIDLIGPNPAKNNTMVEIFGEKATKELIGVAHALELTHNPAKGAWWVKLKQASAIGVIGSAGLGAATGHQAGGVGMGATILITPWALGHLTANPNMLKAFKDGIAATSASRQISPQLDVALTFLRQAAASRMAPVHPRPLSNDQRPTPHKPLPTTEVNRAFTNEP